MSLKSKIWRKKTVEPDLKKPEPPSVKQDPPPQPPKKTGLRYPRTSNQYGFEARVPYQKTKSYYGTQDRPNKDTS